MPFLLAEDTALKAKLQGLVVHDATSGSADRKVLVRYANPEYELADATFPLVLISHTRIAKDEDREHRGMVTVGYAPEGYEPWDDLMDPNKSPYRAEVPIPLNIDYQIDAFARKELHLIEMVGQISRFHFLPARLGYLAVEADNTVRRLDLLGGPDFTESKDQQGKRLFAATWAIRISSEIFLSDLYTATPAQRVLIDFVDKRAWDEGYTVPLGETQEVTRSRLEIPTQTPGSLVVGQPYRSVLTATGGEKPYRWGLAEGQLPPGITLAPNGVLFGTATHPGSYSCRIWVSESARNPQTAHSLFALTATSGS